MCVLEKEGGRLCVTEDKILQIRCPLGEPLDSGPYVTSPISPVKGLMCSLYGE